ncbi:MAG: Fic family protein, partial [Bacteroidota bacterium]
MYTDPSALAPLMPEDSSGELLNIALNLVEEAAKLSNSIHPLTRIAIANLLRPMNSYYSNLIEGHDTNPVDIAKALKQDFSENSKQRSLQLEAKAHIDIHHAIGEKFNSANVNPFTSNFLQWIHYAFYQLLPEEFRKIQTPEGTFLEVIPGEIRKSEVQVGMHVAPAAANLASFMHVFQNQYDPTKEKNRINRIIAIAASHHRLAWIHPFLDGNGRVIRLFSDACFMNEGLAASGLWSMSRGLARNEKQYKEALANADLQRQGNFDGRGNLSNKYLVAFCAFFLTTAIDQVQFMNKILDVDGMRMRINRFVDLMVFQGKLKTESRYILEDVFFKGEIKKNEAERITNTSSKTAKAILDSLVKLELLTHDSSKHLSPYRVSYPINSSFILFSGLYPSNKEMEMMIA